MFCFCFSNKMALKFCANCQERKALLDLLGNAISFIDNVLVTNASTCRTEQKYAKVHL